MSFPHLKNTDEKLFPPMEKAKTSYASKKTELNLMHIMIWKVLNIKNPKHQSCDNHHIYSQENPAYASWMYRFIANPLFQGLNEC